MAHSKQSRKKKRMSVRPVSCNVSASSAAHRPRMVDQCVDPPLVSRSHEVRHQQSQLQGVTQGVRGYSYRENAGSESSPKSGPSCRP